MKVYLMVNLMVLLNGFYIVEVCILSLYES